MPIVPISRRQVQEITPQVSTPRVSAPIAVASGVGVAQAQGDIGRGAGQLAEVIAKRIQQKNLWKQEEQIYDLQSKFSLEAQDLLFNDRTKTISGSDGKNYDIPDGVLNRKLSQADGATVDFDQRIAPLKQKYLDLVPDPQAQKMLSRYIDSHYTSFRNQVISHEASEGTKAAEHVYKSSLDNLVNQSAITADAQSLTTNLVEIAAINERRTMRLGLDEQSSTENLNKYLTNATEKAVIAKLKVTGDKVQAQALLDSVKDKLPEEVYRQVSEKVDIGAIRIKEQEQVAQKEEMVNKRFSVMSQLVDGSLNWENADRVIKDIAASDFDLAEALQKVIKKGGKYSPDEDKNDDFAEVVEKAFDASDKQTLSNILLEAVKDKNISVDRLSILINAAGNRAKTLSTFPQGIPQQNPFGAMIRGLRSFFGSKNKKVASDAIGDFLNQTNKGDDPFKAAEAVKNTERLKKNPWMNTLPPEGEVRVLKDGSKVRLFPNGSVQPIK